ncbi:MAG: hypothetical protein V2G42_07115 [bacterium JZ-2024 1]
MEASLARLSALKAYLGVTTSAQDPELKRILLSASGVVRAFCGRQLHRDTRTLRLRLPRFARSFVLREFPVWNITEVTFVRDSGEESPLSFTFDSFGIVRLSAPPEFENASVRVTYDAGYDTTGWEADGTGFGVPEDLEQAVVHIASIIALSGSAIGDLRIGLRDRSDARAGSVSYDPSLPFWVRATLNRYRTHSLG